MDTSFLSLPMGAGPLSRDSGMTDELGNPVYFDAFGQRYTIKTQNPNRESYVRAGLGALDKARKAPLESLTAGAQAIAQGAWDAVATPGRSWSDTVTYGDVANTAGLVSLPAVAGKYDPAVANMGLRYTRPEGDDFRGWHKAPGRGADNGTFDNLSSIYPDDIYDRRVAAQYYGHGGEPWERSTIDSFAAARGNPDAEVMVYRAVPEGIDDIFAGDWVTPNRAYAEMHGNSWVDDGKYKILAEKVRAGDLYTDANSIHEFGWDPPPRIRAYHGSPHDFDRFDMSKIGTGEGAQAYGHGLYFAESEGVARSYRDNLTDDLSFGIKTEDGDIFDPKELSNLVADELGIRLGDDVGRSGWEWAFRNFAEQGGIDGLDASRMADDFDRAGYEAAESALRDAAGVFSPQYPGRMYEVEINADPADFLDWDAPLREQPRVAEKLGFSARSADDINAEAEAIMAAQPNGAWLNDPAAKARVDALQEELDRLPPRTDGANYYRQTDPDNYLHSVLRDGNSIAGRTDELREAGIPGIKYYDQGSRASGQGTRNYVVFDDSLIEILRKYGLAGLAPLGATLAGSDQAQY